MTTEEHDRQLQREMAGGDRVMSRGSRRASAPADRITRALITAVVLAVAMLVGLALAAAVLLSRAQGPQNYIERDISAFESIVASYPLNPDAWGDYAATLVTAGEYDDAQRVIERGREALTYDDGRLSFEEARLAHAQGDEDAALEKADEAIERATSYRDTRLQELEGQGLIGGGLAIEVRAIAEGYVLKGRIYTELGQPLEAIAAYSAALEETPNAADILSARGDLYADEEDPESAEADYRAALRFIPHYEPALKGLERLGVEVE